MGGRRGGGGGQGGAWGHAWSITVPLSPRPPLPTSQIRASTLRWLYDAAGEDASGPGAAGKPALPSFLQNKLAQIVAHLIGVEYPAEWSTLWGDLMPLAARGQQGVAAWCRVLNALDEEIISMEYPRSPADTARSMRVKDAMREGPAASLASICESHTRFYYVYVCMLYVDIFIYVYIL